MMIQHQSLLHRASDLPRCHSLRIRRQPSHSTPSLRPAFTLIEILVALGLSLILISAIYSAVSIHWRFEEAGRSRIDRSQLTLALFRLLAEDIGSVAYTPPSTTESDEEEGDSTSTSSTSSGSSTASASGSASATSTTDSAASTSTIVVSSDLGVVGTSELLQLDISDPGRVDLTAFSSLASTTAKGPASSQLRVKWGMVTPSSAAAAAMNQGSSQRRSLVIRPALARQMTDRLSDVVGSSDESTDDLKTELNEASILAREVVSLRFRYYDGYSWLDEWDSTTRERLPRAIEVSLGFIEETYKRPGSPNLPGDEKIVQQKHVFLVAASTPVSGDEL